MTTPFLRFALAADAGASGATALLMIAGAGFAASFTDLPAGLLFWAGLALVPYIAFVIWTATRADIPRLAVQAIIEINLLWAIASFALLATDFIAPNGLGIAFVALQALAVLGLGVLQWIALREPRVRTIA